jgi:AraC-like DNA-binding protein
VGPAHTALMSLTKTPADGFENLSAHDSRFDSWMIRTADATQVLAGAFLNTESDSVQHGLSRFECGCPVPTVMGEFLILRAILLDMFFRLEHALAETTSWNERSRARSSLQRAHPTVTLPAFLDSARHLLTDAERARVLPIHERARRWLCEHLNDPCTVHELAARLATNPRTLNRQFARHIGMTVQEYRWKCRVTRASELLSSTEMKVDAVAQAVGIGSKSTLYRLMRRAGHEPPRRTRRTR